MEIYFLRHGKAEKHADCDENRILTPSGKDTISCLGRELDRRNIFPTHLYTSPYLRALQTAKILNKSFDQPLDLQVTKILSCGAHTKGILELLQAHDKKDRIVLVGHMPDFSEITQELLDLPKAIAFETGSFIGLKISNIKKPTATLITQLHPSHYALT